MSANENLVKIFEYALQQEETGKAFFQNSLQRMGVGAAIRAFKRLIQEEEGHILFIKNILEGLKKGNPIELPLGKGAVLEPTNYFDERAKSEFLQQCLEGSMVPLMSNLPLAIAVLLLRFSISQMDVPTRQSHTMAVVAPDERSAAAGITGIPRRTGASLSPVVTGPLLANAALMNFPFFLSGGLKIIYDLLLYRSFKAIKPSEEK